MEQCNENEIKNILNHALNIYHYGSFVYGTFLKNSDYDYIVILPNNNTEFDYQQKECNNAQYSFYTKSTWQKKLDNNDVDAMEIYFLPTQFIVKESVHFHTKIIPLKIRENFSRTASNSFVKCKKKLEVPKSYNPIIGKKSLWHSLRILNFGIQILEKGKIQDYTVLHPLYYEITKNPSNNWEFYKEKYKPIYNTMKTKFRIIGKEKEKR